MRIIVTLAAAFVPTLAFAHTGHGDFSGFASGLLHPLTGIDHLLAISAAGMVGGLIGGRALWALPLTFLASMIVGAGLAAAGGALPLVETLIVLSVVCLGAVAARGVALPVAVALAVSAFFALFHGAAHGHEAPASSGLIDYIAGFTISTAVLLAIGTALGRTAPKATVRLAGATVALGGVALALPL